MRMSDIIEEFIKELFEDKKAITIQENRLKHFINGVKLTFKLEDDLYRIYNDKNEFIGMDFEQFSANLQLASMDPYFSKENMAKIIANQFVGFSKTFMDILLTFCDISEVFNKENTTKLYNTINIVMHNINQGLITLVKYDKDYHIDLNNFSTSNALTPISDFLDDFYFQKESMQSLKTAKFNLQKDVLNFRCKYEKNLKRVNEILEDAYEMEKYKLYA